MKLRGMVGVMPIFAALGLLLAGPLGAETLKGYIDALEGNRLVVAERAIELSPSTRVERRDDPAFSVSGLRPGWEVEVELDGKTPKTATPRAKRLKVLTKPSVPIKVSGFVEKISDAGLRVDGWSIQWPEGLARDGVQLGMDLQGKGELRDDGTVRLHTWKLRAREEDEDERDYMNEIASDLAAMREKLEAASDPPLEEYVTRVGTRIAPDQLKKKGGLAFYVVNDDEPNAFALPDGAIVVHSGLLDVLTNEAQLACVLGHEMAHVTHSHGFRSHQRGRRMSIVTTVASAVVGTVAGVLLHDSGVAQLFGELNSAGSDLMLAATVNGYGRDLEDDADRIGLGYVFDGGYDPYQSVEVWRSLSQQVKDASRVSNWFFGDHSTHRARIANLTNELNARYRRSVQPGALARNDGPYRLAVGRHTALAQYARGNYAAAAETLTKLVSDNPRDAALRVELGDAYLALEPGARDGRALEQYEEAVRIDPKFADGRQALGLLYLRRGERERAKKHLQAFVALAPEREDAHKIASVLKLNDALAKDGLMPLDQYARIVVALMRPGADATKVLRQNGLDLASWQRTNEGWIEAMKADSDLAMEYVRLYQEHSAAKREQAAGNIPPAAESH